VGQASARQWNTGRLEACPTETYGHNLAEKNTMSPTSTVPRLLFLWVLLSFAMALGTARAERQEGTKASAEITLIVPADAEVFVDGAATKQRGTQRVFETPALEVGKKFTYEIRVKWTAAGKPVENTRSVEVTGGGKVRVDFTEPPTNAKGSAKALTEDELFQLAKEVYIYGYPLVTMEMTRRVLTNTEEPKDGHAPMGQFHHSRKYPSASFRDVTAPNADTLYSSAFLDLTKEPYILSILDEADRYYLMPMLSGWAEVFKVPGKRTTGTKAQTYAITGPGWTGKLPEGVTQYKSPTAMVWILGRTYCTGTPEDYKAVHEIQDNLKLVPLSAYGKDYTPPKGMIDPRIDMKTPVRSQVNGLKGADYFKLLANLMKTNPPAKEDGPMVAKLAKLGIVPREEFEPGKIDPGVARLLDAATSVGLEEIVAHFKKAGKSANGWVFPMPTGQYGTDYLQRATIAYFGLGANRPKDAVYPVSQTTADGKAYHGANRYTMTFPKGQLPPVNAFWSLTMYNPEFFFVDNPLNRYTLSTRDKLKENPDGSITLYLQNESPGKDLESNWLPAPKGRFVLMLRLYWPKETDPSILNGTWQPPEVKMVSN
jgi:uncharacterized protein (TIGR03000 family)